MGIFDDTRADWNARPPLRPRTVVPWADRIGVSWHWIGPGKGPSAAGPHSRCLEQVRDWQWQHQHKPPPDGPWKDIGYNGLICQHARAIEGRGLEFSGSHSPGVNYSHIGVQFMVGEDGDPPSPAMIDRAVRLRSDIGRLGHNIRRDWSHRDDPKAQTECAGAWITGWVHSGGPTKAAVDAAPGTPTHPVPIPKPTPKPTTNPSAALTVDGKLGPATIKRWQKVMGTEQDGDISRPSELVRAVQRRLNAKGARLVVDGKGIGSNNNGDYGPTQTVRALQRYLGTKADGVLSHPTSDAVRALQVRLNRNTF